MNTHEVIARDEKATKLAAKIRQLSLTPVETARTMTEEQWADLATVTGTHRASDKTRAVVVRMLEAGA